LPGDMYGSMLILSVHFMECIPVNATKFTVKQHIATQTNGSQTFSLKLPVGFF
jgi:hypothetical protein